MVVSVSPELKGLKDRGDQAYASRDFQTATEWYSEALETQPDAVLLSNRSASYAQRRRFDKALLDADKALKLAPGWPRLYHRRGHALFHLGRYNEAQEAFEKGLKLGEDPALEEALAKLKDYTEPGEDFWVPNAKLAPAPSPAAPSPAAAPAEAEPAKAPPSAKAPAGARAPRVGAFSQARAKDAGRTPESAEDLREKGNKFFREGQHSKAVRAYDEAIRADPQDARCWANRAAAQMSMLMEFGRGLSPEALRTNPYFTNSLADLTQSLQLDPKYVKAWARKGQLHAMASELPAALAAYDRGLALDPAHPDCLAGRRACEGRAS